MATIFANGTYDVQDDITWSNVNQQNIYIVCDTTSSPVTINLPQITPEFINITFYISDKTNNAGTNNIFVIPYSGDTINEGGAFAIQTDGGSCIVTATSSTTTDDNAQPVVAKWLCSSSASGGGGGGVVVSIIGGTDISVDSTNPASPIINYTGTGGSGITGVGTPNFMPNVDTAPSGNIATLKSSSFYDDSSTGVVNAGYLQDNTSSMDFISGISNGDATFHHGGNAFGSNAVLGGSYAQVNTQFATTRGSGVYAAESTNNTYTFVKAGIFDGANFGNNTEISAFKFDLTNIFVNSPNINAGELATFVTAYDSQAGVNKTSLQSTPRIISLTYGQFITLQSTNSVVSGQYYWITDFNDAEAYFGCIFIGSPDGRNLLPEGIGGFVNCDWQGVGDYTNAATYSGVAYSGSTNGQWLLSSQSFYNLGDFVMYNLEMYQVINTGAFNSNPPNLNASAYYRFQKANFQTQGVGYIETWNYITLNTSTFVVTYRYDAVRNNYINNQSLYDFQWGNDNVTDITTSTLLGTISMVNQSGFIKNINVMNQSGFICTDNQGQLLDLLIVNGSFSFNLNNGVFHKYCVYNNSKTYTFGQIAFSPSDSYQGKEITNDYSTFNGTIDCDTLAPAGRITLTTGYTPYLGIICLNTINTPYTIDNIAHSGYLKNITFNFEGATTSGSVEWLNGAGSVYVNTRDGVGGSFIMDNTSSSNLSFAEFHLPSPNVATLSNGVNF